jgi:hypothetical protein
LIDPVGDRSKNRESLSPQCSRGILQVSVTEVEQDQRKVERQAIASPPREAGSELVQQFERSRNVHVEVSLDGTEVDERGARVHRRESVVEVERP